MGNTHSAASCRRPDVAKELLRYAETGDVHSLKGLLEEDARLVLHYSVFGGNSAWHKAAKGGHAAVLDVLEAAVLKQYELDTKDISEILKPSVLRLGSNGADVVTRLINKSNVKGLTPLMLACAGKHTEVVAWLIKHGADVWKHDRLRRHTALHCAAEAGATDAIRLLLAHAGSEEHPGNHRTLMEQGNHAGLTALHYAVYCEQHEVVAQLVAQDADITAQAEFPDLDWGCVNAGDTAMHVAAHRGNIDAIQIMLKAYNEQSGAFLPSQNSARRVRDPRAMRNDYGRLPYHLAVRKGLTWLAEMLDPSVPVRFLLTDEQLDANTAWGPPRLATIAAAVLHRSLVADLKAIQAAQQPQQLAEVPLVMPDAPSAITAQQQVAQLPPAQGPMPTSGSPVEEAGSTTTTSSSAAPRRRWRRSGHQRSNSDAARWVGRLSDITPRAPLSVRRLSTGGLSRVSRRGRASSPGAGPPLVAPGGERLNLQDALGQLSPRAIVAALVGGGAEDTGGNSSSAAAGPASAAGSPPCGASGREESCSPSTGSTWRRLVTRQVRLGGTRQQQQQQSSCASPDPEDCCPHQQGCADEPGQADHKAPGSLMRSASDSFCLVLGDEAEWQKFADAAGLGGGEGDRQQGSSQAAKEVEEIPAVFDSGKVSPFPELKPDVPDGVLEGLLEQYMAELRCPSHGNGLNNSQHQQPQQCGSISSDESQTCGVCLDAAPTAMINPCEHSMCAECALDMCERCPLGTAMCPFCRCIIKSFVPIASTGTKAATAGPAAGKGCMHATATAAPLVVC